MGFSFRRTTKVADLTRSRDAAGLIEVTGDVDPKLRNAAMAALAEIGPSEALLAVIEALAHPSERVRCAAVRLLSHWEQATPLAEAIAWLPAEATSRRLALTALGQLGSADSARPLARSLVHSRAQQGLWEDEVQLVLNLCRSADGGDQLDGVIDLLIDALADEHAEVADRAEDFLLWLDQAAVPALIAQAKSSPTPARVVSVLGQIGGAPVLEPLIEAVDHPDTRTREAACVALGELRDPVSVDALLRATRDPQHGVRVKAAAALDRIGTAAFVASISAMVTTQIEPSRPRPQLAGGAPHGSAPKARVAKPNSGGTARRSAGA